MRLLGLGLVLLLGVACGSNVGDRAADRGAGNGQVVMVLDHNDVERYENSRTICWKWGGGHGSVSCQDKAAP